MRERDLMRQYDPDSPSAVLAHLAYHAPGHHRSLKPMDFSQKSIKERILQVSDDMRRMMDQIGSAPRDAALAYLTI